MTRQRAPTSPRVVLTVAGSDSGGGAGIQADLKTIEAGGAFGTSVITSVTAQHTHGVESTHLVPESEIEAQFDAVTEDFDVAAVKTGMLATQAVVELVTERLAALDVPAVVDPVMVAASGDRLLDQEAESAYMALAREATLLTPNADEAEVLTGLDIDTTADAIRAGEQLVSEGVDAVLLKGGHVPGEAVVDLLLTDEGTERISHPRIDTDATHGSGCMLSAAIATRLAAGDSLGPAVRTGIELLGRAVRYSVDVGDGPGAVHHLVGIRDRAKREETAEQVRSVLDQFVTRDLSTLVPEAGMNIVGATPYAESPDDCVAIEGRIGRTRDGITQRGDIRFGASSRGARLLLAARESHPDLRFTVNCRFDDAVERPVDALDWQLGEYDNHGEGKPDATDGRPTVQSDDGTPVVVIDRDAPGSEPVGYVLATDPSTLVERIEAICSTGESV